jgi:zinc protease
MGPARVSAEPAAAPAPVPSSKETRVALTLGSGMRIILEENHLSPVVAMQAWVAAGSADDAPAQAGLAHVFEHMLWKSTKRRGPGQIAREVEAMGGAADTWTSYDQTVYQLVLASPYLDAGIDVLADALINATFDAGELERTRKEIQAEIRQAQDSPERAATQLLFHAAFAVHPYGRSVMGTEATVAALTRDQLLAAHQRLYVGRNLTLLVVGDFDVAALKGKLVAPAGPFASLRAGDPAPARVAEPAQAAPRTVVSARDLAQTRLLLAFRIPAVSSDDAAALDLLAVILGQGGGARLELGPGRGRQLVDGVSAYTFSSRDAGLLVVSATTAPGRLEEPARALLDEILRLGREEVTEAELARARTVLESSIARDRATAAGYARRLGFFASVGGGADREEAYASRVAVLGAGDLREVAARHLRVAGLTGAALVSSRGVSGTHGLADTSKLTARLDHVWSQAEARASRPPPPVLATSMAMSVSAQMVRVVLSTGVRVVVLQDSTLPLVDVHAVWAGGVRSEDARSNGMSGLLAAMLTRGTRSRAGWQLGAQLGAMSASLAGFSTRDSLGLRAEMPSNQWDRGLELMADCIGNPRFSDDDLELERRAVLDEIRVRDRNPVGAAQRLFASTLWARHPYRLPELGTVESVASITRRRLVDHYHRYYPVSGLTIAVVGNVDATRVVARIQSLLGDAPGAEAGDARVAAPAPEPAHAEPTEVFGLAPTEDAHVVLGYPGVSTRDPDRFPLELLAEILSGAGGRLAAALGEQRPLAYGPTATSFAGLDAGSISVAFACRPQNLEAAVGATRAELARVVERGVSDDELGRARRYLIGARAIGLERRSAVAAALAFHEASGAGWQEMNRYAPGLQRVTAADVQRVARKLLDPRREVVAVVKPAAESPSPVAKRARPDANPTVNPNGAAAIKTAATGRSAAP